MKTPGQNRREPGKSTPPSFCPRPAVTPGGDITTDGTERRSRKSEIRNSPAGRDETNPKSETGNVTNRSALAAKSVESVVKSFSAFTSIVSHSRLPNLHFIAPALYQIAVDCSKLHQIAPCGQGWGIGIFPLKKAMNLGYANVDPNGNVPVLAKRIL